MKKFKTTKGIKTGTRHFKWEDDIKKAEAEWAEIIKKKMGTNK